MSNRSTPMVSDWMALAACAVKPPDSPFRMASKAAMPTLENLICAQCRQCSRIRAGLELLRTATDTGTAQTRVYITEQVTPTYAWLQNNLAASILGSEFEPSWWRRRKLAMKLKQLGGKGTVHYQDVTQLSLGTASLDAIVTFDVLEHVPDYLAAIKEFARVLKPGRTCVATFPFTDGPDTITRARMTSSGEIEHLLEPEYHGDPISGGVLCYYHFGWDILDRFREAGFSRVEMIMPWGHQRGYFYGLWTLVATR